MTEMTEKSGGLALVRDLMFSSKITATARAAAADVRIVRDPANLSVDAAGEFLIVDLNLPGAIEAAAAWRKARNRPVLGFVSHVDTDKIAAAKAAGIDRVVARSGFEATLRAMLETR